MEIPPAVLRSEMIEAIKAEVSVDHEILRRVGTRNLEKKFRASECSEFLIIDRSP